MNINKTLLATALTVGVATTASAEFTTSANVALTNDYVWRGVSQTLEDAAISGGFDVGHESGFYAGVWGSNVDFNEGTEDDADLEIDVYLGVSGELEGGIGWDVGVIRYIYPGITEDFDWNEFYIGGSYGPVSASINFGFDTFGSDDTDSIYYTVGAEHEVAEGVTVHGGVGFFDFDVDGGADPDSYVDYNLGVSGEAGGFGLDLTWYDTNSDGDDIFGSEIADSRVVFTVSKDI